jgi:hypothetical protein
MLIVIISIVVLFIYIWLTYRTILLIPTFLLFFYKKTIKKVDHMIDDFKKDIGDNIDNLSNIIIKSTPKHSKRKKEKRE